MVAFNRLSERYLKGEIDSYYIISIDGKDNKVTFFDLYQHLPYTNYNVGTGQVMLKERHSLSHSTKRLITQSQKSQSFTH